MIAARARLTRLDTTTSQSCFSPPSLLTAQGTSDRPLPFSQLDAGVAVDPMNAIQDSGFHIKRFVFLLSLPLIFLALNQSPTFSAQVNLLLEKFCSMVPAQYCPIGASAYER